jgi:hypothetical protein
MPDYLGADQRKTKDPEKEKEDFKGLLALLQYY